MVSSSARYRRASARAASRTASSASALSNPRGLGDDAAIARYDDGGRGPHRRASGYAEGCAFTSTPRNAFGASAEPVDGRKQAKLTRIRNEKFKVMGKMSSAHRATYADRVLGPLVVWLRRIAPRRDARGPQHPASPAVKMASTVASLRVVAPASVASKRGVTLRARAPGTSPVVATSPRRPLVWIGARAKSRARHDVDGNSPTRAARVRRRWLARPTRLSPLTRRTRTPVSSSPC